MSLSQHLIQVRVQSRRADEVGPPRTLLVEGEPMCRHVKSLIHVVDESTISA